MKNGLASSSGGSGQLLLNLVGGSGAKKSSGSSGKAESGSASFKDIIRSIFNSSEKAEAKAPAGGDEKQKYAGLGNLTEGSKTQGWCKKLPPKEAEIAKDRLQALVDEGSVSLEELEDMPEEAVEELVAWLLMGANGRFEPVEEFSGEGFDIADIQSVFEDSEILQKLEASAEGLQGESVPEKQVTSEQMPESGKSLLDNLANLEGLTDEEKELLAREVKSLLLEQSAGESINLDSNSGVDAAALADRLSSGEGEEMLKEILSGMSKEDIAGLLKEAADNIGKPEVFSGSSLEKLPKAILESLSVKLVDVENSEKIPEKDGGRKLLDELGAKSGKRNVVYQSSGKEKAVEQEVNVVEGEGEISAPVEKDAKGADDDVEFMADGEAADDLDIFSDFKVKPAVGPGASDAVRSDIDVDGMEDMIKDVGKANGAHSNVNENQEVAAQRYVNTDKNIEKITQAMKLSVKRGISSATLQLAPVELGKVKLQVSMNNGVMSATIRTESAEARNMLLSGVAQLRETVTAQGIKFGEFDIYYENGQSSQNTPEDFTNQFSRRRGSKHSRNTEIKVESASEEKEIGVIGNGFVNMIA